MLGGTLARYFGMRFLGAAAAVFGGIFMLIVLVDYVEMTRQASKVPNASALLVAQISLFRVPQVTERIIPFAVLIGAMVCYLTLSRRLELVVARAAGISAWQFVAPAIVVALLMGAAATMIYNPISANLREYSKRLEADLFGERTGPQVDAGFWVSQRDGDGQALINAAASRNQGAILDGVTVLTFDAAGRFRERIEAKTAELDAGYWRLKDVVVYAIGVPPRQHGTYQLTTTLTPEQVRESFATPETVSFWNLRQYIELAENAGLAAAGYRLQYQLLLARPFLLAAMVILAASVSLRFFRFGGVTRMILSGVIAGFLLYVLSKVTEDVSRADLMHPVAAAWLPVLAGGLTGFLALLHMEDG
ncbi:MAG TPA: LPS export ABC transporter permease LptG [Xanthobacteraceae bacterium]|nr:LPS export ABC transporter permease LptG [Xanthobacteraceae bacterium]